MQNHVFRLDVQRTDISWTRHNLYGEWKRFHGFPFPLGHDFWGVVKKSADILATLTTERKGRCE